MDLFGRELTVRLRTLAIAVLLFAGACTCRNGHVSTSDSNLELSADVVQFPRTFVGHPTKAAIELRNVGKPPREAALETDAPFSVEPLTANLGGGDSLELALTFAPGTAGPFERTLRVTSEGASLTATLRGTAEAIPSCTARGPCWRAHFDVESASCVDEKAEDGTSCPSSSACLTDAVCADGDCVGKGIDCDDRDACTTDTCDEISGCVHFSATSRCASSTDPCKVPACDAVVGCTFVDAADGVSCGESDCESAQVCMRGACTRVRVSDGAACGTESPCQPRGLCAGKTCVRPPPTDLVPAWTVWGAPNRALLWDSIADRDGNVYWRENDNSNGTSWLVSVTRQGFPRYSVSVMQATEMALIEQLLVLRQGAWVEAHRIADGSILWRRELRSTAPGVADTSTRTLARGPPGTVYVGHQELAPPDKDGVVRAVGAVISQLNLADGSTRWEVRLPGRWLEDTTPVDEAHYLYAGTVDLTTSEHRYLGFTPLGAVRWDTPNPHAAPAAVFGGRVYHWDHWLSETSTGAWVNAQPPTLNIAGYPRLALGAVNFAGTTTSLVPSCSMPGTLVMGTSMQLVRVDPPTSQLRWHLEIAGASGGGISMTNTVLTSRSTIVFSQVEDYCERSGSRHVLREVSAFGEPSFSCRLPGPERYEGLGLLHDGYWVSSVVTPTGAAGVRAFALRGFELPPHGWATALGSAARDTHAR